MELDDEFKLKHVIAVYQVEDNSYTRGKVYIEQHDVGEVDGKSTLCAGRPLEKKTITAMAKTVLINGDTPGYLPANLLSFSDKLDTRLLWWMPAHEKHLFFHKSTKIPSGKAHIPAMLFYVKNTTLNVFALKRKRRPLLSTRMYRVPFPNCGGSVCMGSAKCPKPGKPFKMMMEWENAFYGSEFTHSTNVELWTRQVETDRAFPNEELKPHHLKTLEHLIKREEI